MKNLPLIHTDQLGYKDKKQSICLWTCSLILTCIAAGVALYFGLVMRGVL